MILVREISKSFGPLKAVSNVSFELGNNQVVGLLGPNGAGKSTTIRMTTGFLAPDSGSITIAGYDIAKQPSHAKSQIGYLPEQAPIYPEMSVRGYLKHRARLFGVETKHIKPAIERAMDMCHIDNVARRRVGHLSKGYKQRVGLAGALIHDPPVLILDEPTNGLDPSQIRDSRSLIRDLAENKTMLVCSHILPEIERICDRVMIMNHGSIQADGTPQELISQAPGPTRYTVEIRTNPTAGIAHALRVLAMVPGVDSTIPDEQQPEDASRGWSRIIINAVNGEGDLREPIAGAAEDKGLFIRELTKQRQSLESIFMGLIDPAPTHTPAGPAAISSHEVNA
ncbi:MAG: ABC transporter ATP-binding protein [Phycisphaerales bacterium]|nr:ABC transporter ATP-binding protein [Phycisphaerales bacterium]